MLNTATNFIEKLENAIQRELPGVEAQLKMAHVFRKSKTLTYQVPDNARKAGVLNLLYPKNGVWHTVLMKRVVFDPTKDKHSGQVSFPGGRYELSDKTMEVTALRESEEEIGINRENVQIIGKLTNLYIPVSNYLVYPYVAVAEERPEFIPNRREVAQLIEVPIHDLLENEQPTLMDLPLHNGTVLKDVPYFDAQGHVVWGATAMMLSEFATLVKRVI